MRNIQECLQISFCIEYLKSAKSDICNSEIYLIELKNRILKIRNEYYPKYFEDFNKNKLISNITIENSQKSFPINKVELSDLDHQNPKSFPSIDYELNISFATIEKLAAEFDASFKNNWVAMENTINVFVTVKSLVEKIYILKEKILNLEDRYFYWRTELKLPNLQHKRLKLEDQIEKIAKEHVDEWANIFVKELLSQKTLNNLLELEFSQKILSIKNTYENKIKQAFEQINEIIQLINDYFDKNPSRKNEILKLITEASSNFDEFKIPMPESCQHNIENLFKLKFVDNLPSKAILPSICSQKQEMLINNQSNYTDSNPNKSKKEVKEYSDIKYQQDQISPDVSIPKFLTYPSSTNLSDYTKEELLDKTQELININKELQKKYDTAHSENNIYKKLILELKQQLTKLQYKFNKQIEKDTSSRLTFENNLQQSLKIGPIKDINVRNILGITHYSEQKNKHDTVEKNTLVYTVPSMHETRNKTMVNGSKCILQGETIGIYWGDIYIYEDGSDKLDAESTIYQYNLETISYNDKKYLVVVDAAKCPSFLAFINDPAAGKGWSGQATANLEAKIIKVDYKKSNIKINFDDNINLNKAQKDEICKKLNGYMISAVATRNILPGEAFSWSYGEDYLLTHPTVYLNSYWAHKLPNEIWQEYQKFYANKPKNINLLGTNTLVIIPDTEKIFEYFAKQNYAPEYPEEFSKLLELPILFIEHNNQQLQFCQNSPYMTLLMLATYQGRMDKLHPLLDCQDINNRYLLNPNSQTSFDGFSSLHFLIFAPYNEDLKIKIFMHFMERNANIIKNKTAKEQLCFSLNLLDKEDNNILFSAIRNSQNKLAMTIIACSKNHKFTVDENNLTDFVHPKTNYDYIIFAISVGNLEFIDLVKEKYPSDLSNSLKELATTEPQSAIFSNPAVIAILQEIEPNQNYNQARTKKRKHNDDESTLSSENNEAPLKKAPKIQKTSFFTPNLFKTTKKTDESSSKLQTNLKPKKN